MRLLSSPSTSQREKLCELAPAMHSRPLLSPYQIYQFQRRVYEYYRNHGRDLPWRKTADPYKVLVSEIMLQQTQVARVIQKYEWFIRTFPDVESLARATLRDILKAWQGLGYNRRALALKKTAEILLAQYGGTIPSSIHSLTAMPGIGSTTAHAIRTFAFNQPTVFVETNVRTVFIHHFFADRQNITDTEIRVLVAQTLDRKSPRKWYHALMDYGVALKKEHTNPSRRSAHYRKQGPFEGSDRQVRGMILQTLVKIPKIAIDVLLREMPFGEEAVKKNLKRLEKEGQIVTKRKYISIA